MTENNLAFSLAMAVRFYKPPTKTEGAKYKNPLKNRTGQMGTGGQLTF